MEIYSVIVFLNELREQFKGDGYVRVFAVTLRARQEYLTSTANQKANEKLN